MLFSPSFSCSLTVITAALAASASAHGSDGHVRLHRQQHQERQSSSVVITSGANGFGDNQIHPRLEISDLANRPEQWALYIQTMAAWQAGSKNSSTSYFGIASIHGVPRQDWDGVASCSSCTGADGYCPHNSVLFPAWHRAYTALYEQEFLGVANAIANSYPAGSKRDAMVKASSTLRTPYWDWAAKADSGLSVLPAAISSPQVTFEGPNGQQTIANPLYQFDVGSDEDGKMVYGPFTNWQSTLRYPNTNDASASSVEDSCTNTFDSIQQTMQDQVYQLLTACTDYLPFSNDNAGTSSSACSNSLESIHNTIHMSAGGPGSKGVSGGHMTYLPLAAYDPIFWLHHANVDRLFALWQTANPGSYGASQVAAHSTWTIASGSTQDQNSPLEPFRKDASSFYTTMDVKDWTMFKYTYPEFVATDGSRSAIISIINRLYGSNPDLTASAVSKLMKDASNTTSSASNSSSIAGTSTASSISSSPARKNSTASGFKAAQSSASATVSAEPKRTDTSFGLGGMVGSMMSDLGATATADSPVPMITEATGMLQNLTNTVASMLPPMPSGLSNLIPSFLAPNGSEYQYICNIETPHSAFNQSYYVYVFNGQPQSNDSSTWFGDKSLVGAIGVLAGGSMHAPGLKVSGSVPLTRHLQNQVTIGSLLSMSEQHIVPYLAQNINWRIVVQGDEVHPSTVPGFQSSVFSGTSVPAGPDSLPRWSPLQVQPDVTNGKSGGYQCPSESSSASSESQGSSSTAAPVAASSSAPAYSSSAPAYSSSAPAYSSAAPVYSSAAPVYSSAAPVYSSAAPAYSGAAPAYSGAASSAVSPRPISTSPAGYMPAGNGTRNGTSPYSAPVPYTGAASKASFLGMAGLMAVIGFAAVL